MSTLDISRLSVAERLDLIGDLCDSLSAEALTSVQQVELARRIGAGMDDLDWAKPYVDEALAQIERGEVFTLGELEARLDARFGPLAK
jgi:putative addiction module component (TIGR02574 family)